MLLWIPGPRLSARPGMTERKCPSLRGLPRRIRGEPRTQTARIAHAVARKIGARFAARGRRALLPFRGAFGGLQHAQIAHRFQLLPGVRLGAVAHRVDAANLERIDSELLRTNIEMRLGRELRLQRAER